MKKLFLFLLMIVPILVVAQTTVYSYNMETPKCDSTFLASKAISAKSTVVGKDKYGRDIWRSSRGSFYIIVTPRSGGCAYKKYIKTING